MKKAYLILITISIIGIVVWLLNSQVTRPETKLYHASIRDVEIRLELADTNQKRIKGLSDRTKLDEDRGLLFIFYSESFPSIWMKDMNFAIDVIWLDKDLKIVDIKKNATPESYPEVFVPARLAQYVLEVSAGFVDDKGIREGDTLTVEGLEL